MSKALAPTLSAAATLADDDLDSLVAGIADTLGVDELAPLDVCATCDHMANQHEDGGCMVVGCDCGAFEAAAAADDEAAIHVDAVEYAGTPGAFEVVGFQIAAANLSDRLNAAVRELVAGQDAAAPVVRLRLEELAMRSFAPGVSPPPDGGIGIGSLEWDAVLAPEGRLTDDGRAFAPGAIKWRELPLTLMAMLETAEGHDGARVCGRIDRIWRDDATGLIRASGVFDDSEYGHEIARMVDEKVLRGNSVDLAIHDYEVGPRSNWFDDDGNWAPTEAAAEQDEPDLVDLLFDEPSEPNVYLITDAVIGMSTVCPFPAFADAFIEVGRSLAAAGSPAVWTVTSDAGFVVRRQVLRAPSIESLTASARSRIVTALERGWLTDQGYSVLTHIDGPGAERAGDLLIAPTGPIGAVGPTGAPGPSLTAGGGGTSAAILGGQGGGGAVGTGIGGGAGGAGGSWIGPSTARGGGGGGGAGTIDLKAFAARAPEPALTAAVTPPVSPPAAWFADPELTEATPIVVTDDGRIFGHAAAWGSCHTGFPDVCVTPPHTATGYRFFHLKSCECDDGTLADVGTITLEAPHANQNLGLVEASAHYDHTGLAAADVVVGEDAHGIWVAGAVRPHMTAEMIRELRGAVLSGDWRNYEGNLELIGLLAVNVPGFPIPKVRARVAGGYMQSLVAAGVIGLEITDVEPPGVDAAAAAQLAALADDQVAVDLAELARDAD